MKNTDYPLLNSTLSALIEGIPYETANLANASALLWQHLKDINWAGFYKLEGENLILGPFQGKPACIVIPVGRGVCGTAVAQDRTQLVADVHAFPGHIACDSASRSEIVVPIHIDGRIWGVLDIDSPSPGRFSPADQAGLEEFVKILQTALLQPYPEHIIS
jgi:GAF domain-containing protein